MFDEKALKEKDVDVCIMSSDAQHKNRCGTSLLNIQHLNWGIFDGLLLGWVIKFGYATIVGASN